jgi:hypothetical protein
MSELKSCIQNAAFAPGRALAPWIVERRKREDYFIFDETIGMKQLIRKIYQMVKRFTPDDFRCNQPVAAIISKSMKRYLDKMEISCFPAEGGVYRRLPDFG